MGIQLKHITNITVALAAASIAAAPAALAQEVQTIPQAIDSAFFGFSGNFFESTRPANQFTSTLGLGGFPEQRIAWDAAGVSAIFREQMALQNTADPIIRVPDLATPFTSSLLLSPAFQQTGGAVGGGFIFEAVPRR